MAVSDATVCAKTGLRTTLASAPFGNDPCVHDRPPNCTVESHRASPVTATCPSVRQIMTITWSSTALSAVRASDPSAV